MILLIVIVYNQSRKTSQSASSMTGEVQIHCDLKMLNIYIFFITYKFSNLTKFLGSQMADLWFPQTFRDIQTP